MEKRQIYHRNGHWKLGFEINQYIVHDRRYGPSDGFCFASASYSYWSCTGKNERRCKLIVRKNAVSSVTILVATNTSVIGAITTANLSLWAIDM